MMIRRLATYLFPFFVFVCCTKDNAVDCFKSNGSDKTETRYLDRFDSVKVNDKFDVTISSGSEYKVEVIAGKHIIKNIFTKVKNGELIIENNNRCNFVRGYKRKMQVHITTPYLKRIFHNGVGPVTFENFTQDTVNVKAENSGDTYLNGTFDVINTSSHGNGDMYLSGWTRNLNVYSKGTNYTHAENLTVRDYIFISTSSLGDTYLNANGLGLLDYYVWSDGNIYYTGKPASIRELSDGSAKGQVIKED
jgi:hypothetical protein